MKLYTYIHTSRELSNVYRFVTIKLSIFDFIDSRTWIFLPDNIDDQIMYVFKPKFFLVIVSPLAMKLLATKLSSLSDIYGLKSTHSQTTVTWAIFSWLAKNL